jgi:tetratricopeptide (TPR) repeat protein
MTYNLEIDYMVPGFDISREELLEIIEEVDRIIAETAGNPEKTAETYLKKSQCLQKLGEYAESRVSIEKALSLFPDMAEAIVQLGNIYLAEKNYDEAIVMYNQAMEINPGYAAAFTGRGIAYYGKGEQERAIADYTEAIRLRPDNAIALINRLKSYDKIGEYNKAEQDEEEVIRLHPGLAPVLLILNDDSSPSYEDIEPLTGAINLKPNNVDYFYRRARNYMRLGEYDKAIADWTDVIRLRPEYSFYFEYRGDAYVKKGDCEKAIADYTECIRLESKKPDAFEKRGNAYKALGQQDEAAADHKEANRLGQKFKLKSSYSDHKSFPSDIWDVWRKDKSIDTNTAGPGKLAETYLNQYLFYFCEKREPYGREYLIKTLDIHSGMNWDEVKRLKSAFVLTRMADIACKLDNIISRWTSAINKQSDKTVRFLNNRGIMYAEKANYGRGIAEWVSTIPEKESAVQAWFRNYEADYGRALVDLTEAIEAKNLEPASLARVYQNRGILYIDLQEYESAITDFSEAAALWPWPDNTDTSLFCRGIAYDDKGDYEKAVADYTEAIRLSHFPLLSSRFFNRGIVYDKMGEYGKAISDYTAAIRLNRHSSSALYNRCLVYKTIGQLDKVEADILKIKLVDKNYREAISRFPRYSAYLEYL